jgi:hypothetical protein
MPTREHEMWLELLRERPALTADLLECVRADLVPAFSQARLESGDLSEHAPAAYHADALVTFGGEQHALAVVVEVQLRPDRRKHLSWPAYLATARARLNCPVMLLVICPESRAAAWARRPISLGHPGLVLTPLVLGPEEVPVLTVAEDTAAPELAVVSAAVHGAGPEGAKVFSAMLESFEKIEPQQARSYIDEVLAVLPEAARKLLEAIVETRNREYKSDFARGYEARGEAKAVLAVLATRGIDVPEEARVRISECTDLELLESWVPRAVTAASVDELFDE